MLPPISAVKCERVTAVLCEEPGRLQLCRSGCSLVSSDLGSVEEHHVEACSLHGVYLQLGEVLCTAWKVGGLCSYFLTRH